MGEHAPYQAIVTPRLGAQKQRHSGGPGCRPYRRLSAPLSRALGTIGNPDHGRAAGVQTACFSLSHKGLDVSYCENRAVGGVGLLLRTATTSADLGFNGFAERSISRCETLLGLCDRLEYASGNARYSA
jgi:hypothetical protein